MIVSSRVKIAVMLLISILCNLQSLAETVEIKGYLYDLDRENRVAVLKRYTGTSTTVVIPNTIKYEDTEYSVVGIHNRAFRDSKMQKRIKKISIGGSVKSIDDNTFENCVELSTVTIGQSVSTIGYSAFCGCSKLTTIKIPDSVIIIGSYAFAECISLTSVVIGSSVASIGDKAFSYCNKLRTVTCYADKVPTTEITAFVNTNLSDITLYILKSAIEDYRISEPWNKFGNISAINKH